MDIATVESFCINGCFSVLFITTLYYWSKTIFSKETSYNQTGLIGYGSALLLLTIHLVIRWIDSGHFPLSNLYESLVFLAWCLVLLHICLEHSIKTPFLAVFTAPALLCLIAFTDFSLPPELQRGGPLVPALQSNWLVMHVTVMIASYAALLLGCFVSIAYLIFSTIFGRAAFKNSKRNSLPENNVFINANSGEFEVFGVEQVKTIAENQELTVSSFLLGTKQSDFLLVLDNLSYRTIGLGFCFLTLGILSGAVWANETWGNYWSWDPKETWAFITWLTFATYLHSRLIGGWTGAKPAWIASFGFFIVWVCYLGVNLLGHGLHSYGFLEI